MGSLWLGWPGDFSRFTRHQREYAEGQLAALRAQPVHLSQAEIKKYYEGFCNGVLWPLFHYLTDKIRGMPPETGKYTTQ